MSNIDESNKTNKKQTEEKVCKDIKRREKFLKNIIKIEKGIGILSVAIIASNILKKCMDRHDTKLLNRYGIVGDALLHDTLTKESKDACVLRFNRRIQNNILSHDETVNMFRNCFDQMEKDGYTIEQANLILSRDKFSDESFMKNK